MQIHITINGDTTDAQLTKLSAALLTYVGDAEPVTGQRVAGVEGEALARAPAPAPAETKAEPAPKSRAKAKPEPKEEPAPEPEVEEKPAAKAETKVDYAALRAETRELFAAYAEEAGTAKGLALLQDFDVSKFKDLGDGQLAGMRERLLELGE